MSNKTILIDDMEQEETIANETVDFGLDGVGYEIDLTSKNAVKLRNSLAPFIAAARKSSGARRVTVTRPRPVNAGREQKAAVRDWLRSQGHKVSHKGRIPQELQDLFDREHAREGHPVKPAEQPVFSGV